jgi:uncharacterized protein YndB with AHSA1/START domain
MRTINLSVEIHAPAEKVWRALATADEISRWFAPIVTGGDAVGEELHFKWYPGGEYSSTLSAREEGRHLRWGDDALVTDWYIEPQAGGVTILRLVNSGWGDGADWDEQYDATAGGWRYFLFNLRDYVENHAGQPRTLLMERRATREPRAAVLDRLLAAAPKDLRIVTTEAPNRLWGTLPAHGNALLFVENEPGADKFHYGVYVTLYGDALRFKTELETQIGRMLDAADVSKIRDA